MKVFVSVSWIVSNLLFKVIVHGRSEVSHSSEEEEELLFLDPTLRGLTATRYHIASWAPELVTSRHVQQKDFMGKWYGLFCQTLEFIVCLLKNLPSPWNNNSDGNLFCWYWYLFF